MGNFASPEPTAVATGRVAAVRRVASGLREVKQAATESAVAIAANNDAFDVMRERIEAAQSMASSFASSLISDLRSGRSITESLSDAFGNLADQLLQMAADQAIKSLFGALMGSLGGGIGGGVTGGTWGNGLWGSAIFGGARAGGGPVQAGKAYLVGEKRPELFVPRTGGTILPDASKAVATPSLTVNFAPVIHGGAVTRKELAEVLAVERQRFARELPGLYKEAYRRAQL